MNLVLKEIKRLVSCGLITLIGFNFFIGCSSPMEPEEISSIVNDMLPFVDPEFFEETGEEVTE